MKIRHFIFLFGISFLLSCGGDSAGSQQTGDQAGGTDTITSDSYENAGELPGHDCEISNEVLEGNQFYARSEDLLLAITADSTTLDENLGPSHRILEVYNTKTCDRIQREVLPVNVSADFPYYLAEITYNNANKLIGIRGFNNIYIYDLENKQLLPLLEPQFKQERYGVDAQSGMIQRLEVWEDYLIGSARDYGAFAFNLSDKQKPEAVLPFAEYEQEEQFYSLFLLQLDEGKFQAILPRYDIEADKFAINPAFNRPMAVSTNIPASARNNRYLVLRQTTEDRSAVAIDLLQQKRVELPDNIKTQKTQDILNWLKK